jgi:hypothetical protein
MPQFDRVLQALRRLWTGEMPSSLRRGRLPPVIYRQVSFVRNPPRNSEISEGALTIVAPAKKPKWSMFLCPCGCRTVITLSLQPTKRPHWTFKRSWARRPTLYPSIWRDVGCFSHFFIEDGRVFWCGDTGVPPEQRRTN